MDALRQIARQEGVLSLWKGLTASLLGCVHAVIQFPLYEAIKTHTAATLNQVCASPSHLSASTC